MESTPMTVYFKDGLQEVIMLELVRSATLSDLRKKLIEKGVKPDKYHKYISNGKVLREEIPLQYQRPSSEPFDVHRIDMGIN